MDTETKEAVAMGIKKSLPNADAVANDDIVSALEKKDVLEHILPGISEVTQAIKNSDKVEIDLSDENIKDTSNLTPVKYEEK